MTVPCPSRPSGYHPVLRRFSALARLDRKDVGRVQQALANARPLAAKQDILVEGHDVCETVILVSGWAARTRVLEDGRRQIINFLLPGDLIGLCDQEQPIASSTIIALTDTSLCPAPDRLSSPAIRHVYAMSRALEEAYLFGQITRLGRLSGHERIEDLLLELLERLELAGLSAHGRFAIPLTQEMLADAVGLTPVHVNRMLQQARHAGALTWRAGILTFHDPDAVRRKAGRQKVRVSAPWPRPTEIAAE